MYIQLPAGIKVNHTPSNQQNNSSSLLYGDSEYRAKNYFIGFYLEFRMSAASYNIIFEYKLKGKMTVTSLPVSIIVLC